MTRRADPRRPRRAAQLRARPQPGRPGPRAGPAGGDQAGQQRGAVRPAARRGRGGHRGRRRRAPLPGHGRGRAARRARPSGTASTPDRIATGCGSVALAEHLVRATCLPGDEIVYSWRSFEAYPIIAATTGATSVRVPNDAGHGHDLDGDGRGDHRPDPAGPRLQPQQPDRYGGAPRRARRVPRRRAGRRAGRARRGVPGVRHRPRRARRPRRPTATGPTSSCCARCPRRGGWPACGSATWSPQPEVAAAVRKVVTPFSTSAVAQAAALAALQQAEEVRRRCALVVAERERVTDGGPQARARTCPTARPTSSGCRWATGRPSSARPARSRA